MIIAKKLDIVLALVLIITQPTHGFGKFYKTIKNYKAPVVAALAVTTGAVYYYARTRNQHQPIVLPVNNNSVPAPVAPATPLPFVLSAPAAPSSSKIASVPLQQPAVNNEVIPAPSVVPAQPLQKEIVATPTLEAQQPIVESVRVSTARPMAAQPERQTTAMVFVPTRVPTIPPHVRTVLSVQPEERLPAGSLAKISLPVPVVPHATPTGEQPLKDPLGYEKKWQQQKKRAQQREVTAKTLALLPSNQSCNSVFVPTEATAKTLALLPPDPAFVPTDFRLPRQMSTPPVTPLEVEAVQRLKDPLGLAVSPANATLTRLQLLERCKHSLEVFMAALARGISPHVAHEIRAIMRTYDRATQLFTTLRGTETLSTLLARLDNNGNNGILNDFYWDAHCLQSMESSNGYKPFMFLDKEHRQRVIKEFYTIVRPNFRNKHLGNQKQIQSVVTATSSIPADIAHTIVSYTCAPRMPYTRTTSSIDKIERERIWNEKYEQDKRIWRIKSNKRRDVMCQDRGIDVVIRWHRHLQKVGRACFTSNTLPDKVREIIEEYDPTILCISPEAHEKIRAIDADDSL